MRSQSGQTTVEWVGLILLVSLALGAFPALALHVDGRSFGGFLAHSIVCAARGGCEDGDAELARAYGARDAELVRRLAPSVVYEPGERSLPVDYRRCRSRRCADAADERGADLHRSEAGERATVFVHVVHRGGRTYLQYWLYYPDSNTTWAASDKLWRYSPLARAATRLATGRDRYPGFHPDDWEGYGLRVERNGDIYARATAHGGYQGCKQAVCHNRWVRPTGWTRVSRGSHAGHIPYELLGPPRPGRRPGHGRRGPWRMRPLLPGRDIDERTSTAEGLRLVPLERVRRGAYRPLDRAIKPPWRKKAYREPWSDES